MEYWTKETVLRDYKVLFIWRTGAKSVSSNNSRNVSDIIEYKTQRESFIRAEFSLKLKTREIYYEVVAWNKKCFSTENKYTLFWE